MNSVRTVASSKAAGPRQVAGGRLFGGGRPQPRPLAADPPAGFVHHDHRCVVDPLDDAVVCRDEIGADRLGGGADRSGCHWHAEVGGAGWLSWRNSIAGRSPTRWWSERSPSRTTQGDLQGDPQRAVRVPDVAPPAGFTFNQFLIEADEPLLFHTGPRAMFSLVSEAVARVTPVGRLRWITSAMWSLMSAAR